MWEHRNRLGLATIVVAVVAGAPAVAWGGQLKRPISASHARAMKADLESAMRAERSALLNPGNFDAPVRASVTWLGKALKLGKGVDTGGAHFQAYRALQFDKDALGTNSFARNNRERWVRQALGYERQAVKDLAAFAS